MIIIADVVNDEQVYRLYAAELTRYATGLVGPFDAADVVTDACLRAFASKGWQSVDNRRAYLYRTVHNVARDQHRSTLARRLREIRSADREEVPAAEVDVDVLAAVARLSVQQRSAVYLTYWEDLTPERVGEVMGISSGTVKRHLARARKRLGEWLA